MVKKNIEYLQVSDNDLECNCIKSGEIEKLTIDSLGFTPVDLERFDLIVYKGKLGTKILKSCF